MIPQISAEKAESAVVIDPKREVLKLSIQEFAASTAYSAVFRVYSPRD